MEKREAHRTNKYSINSKVFLRVVPRPVDPSHRRRERRRGPETDQRHDWKRTLASLHSLWELRNFPDGRHPFSNSVICAVLFVLQMLLLFRQFGEAISMKRHWLFQLCVYGQMIFETIRSSYFEQNFIGNLYWRFIFFLMILQKIVKYI